MQAVMFVETLQWHSYSSFCKGLGRDALGGVEELCSAGGRWEGGWGNTAREKNGLTYSTPTKSTTASSCYAYAADMRAGSWL